jgi:hypothetical protein
MADIRKFFKSLEKYADFDHFKINSSALLTDPAT